MTKRKEQRAAAKLKRRTARKAQSAHSPQRTARRPARAADGMLDEETYARIGYDPLRVPASLDWLALDEAARLSVVEAYHRLLPTRQRPPNEKLHASIHAIIETQLAEGDPPEVGRALARLSSQGLDRHSAIHAIGTILSEYLRAVMQGASAFDSEGYRREVATLTRDSWLARLA